MPVCGALIDQPDAVAFARAIHSLLDQPELREKMGAAGRRKMEMRHDILKTQEAFASLFDKSLVDQSLVDQSPFDQNSFDRKPAADQRSSVSVASTSRSTAME